MDARMMKQAKLLKLLNVAARKLGMLNLLDAIIFWMMLEQVTS